MSIFLHFSLLTTVLRRAGALSYFVCFCQQKCILALNIRIFYALLFYRSICLTSAFGFSFCGLDFITCFYSQSFCRLPLPACPLVFLDFHRNPAFFSFFLFLSTSILFGKLAFRHLFRHFFTTYEHVFVCHSVRCRNPSPFPRNISNPLTFFLMHVTIHLFMPMWRNR